MRHGRRTDGRTQFGSPSLPPPRWARQQFGSLSLPPPRWVRQKKAPQTAHSDLKITDIPLARKVHEKKNEEQERAFLRINTDNRSVFI